MLGALLVVVDQVISKDQLSFIHIDWLQAYEKQNILPELKDKIT